MDKDKKNLLFVSLNSLAVLATIIVNTLAVVLPLNGKQTGTLSDNIPNLFVPSGITFSIWSIIYIFLIIFMLKQILDLTKKANQDIIYIEKIGFWFVLASLANIIWIFLWHYEYVTFSLLAMLLLFFSLLVIYQRLKIGLTDITFEEKITVNTPISLYIGWITVATIANVTAVLVTYRVGELFIGQVNWTILVIAVTTLITILIIYRRKDIAYSLVIIWALLGIIIKRQSADPIYENIIITAIIAIVIIGLIMVIKFIMTRNTEKIKTQ